MSIEVLMGFIFLKVETYTIEEKKNVKDKGQLFLLVSLPIYFTSSSYLLI